MEGHEQDDVMAAFADRVEDSASVVLPSQQTQVMIRPVGAQAIAIRRDPSKVLNSIKVFAAAAGDNWFYSWDVKDKNSKRADGKTTIEGASVKLANDVARLYGNCSAGIDRVDDIGTHWVFHASFVDFETGYEYRRPFQQRKSQNASARMDADRAMDIAFQIGASKCVRNVVVNALGTFTDFALDAAKGALVDKIGKRLDFYRDKAVARLADLGVTPERVALSIGKVVKDWTAGDVAKVIAEIQAVNEGMTTAAELWAVGAGGGDDPKPKDKLEQFAGATNETAKPQGVATTAAKVEEPAKPADKAGSGEPAKTAEKATPKPAEPKQTAAPVSDPVPPNVGFDPAHNNFYFQGEGENKNKGMGNAFHAKWVARAKEFPQLVPLSEPKPIPDNAFYSMGGDAFVDGNGDDMGDDFYHSWIDRRDEFPLVPAPAQVPADAERAPGPRLDAPLPDKLAGKADAAGRPLNADALGEVVEDIPEFLVRQPGPKVVPPGTISGAAVGAAGADAPKATAPAAAGSAVSKHEPVAEEPPPMHPNDARDARKVALRFPGMPPDFIAGYVARSKLADLIPLPKGVGESPSRKRNYELGYNMRDGEPGCPSMPK